MNAYDAAGNLLGTTTVTAGATSLKADSVAPFMGLRSVLKEIARVEIDASSAHGFTIGGLKVGLNPIADNDLFFVKQMFQDLYGRAPSAAELAADLGALKQGMSTRAQLAESLFDAAEFHDNAGFLVKCYTALLQVRPRPSSAGPTSWTTAPPLRTSSAT
jgi:hypothetical protein